MQTSEKLATTVAAILDIGSNARRLADALRRHQHGEDHQLNAALHRLGTVMRDVAAGVDHASAGLSASAIAAR